MCRTSGPAMGTFGLLLLLHLSSAHASSSFTYFGPNYGPTALTASPRSASPGWSAFTVAPFTVAPFTNGATSNPWQPLPAISFVPDLPQRRSDSGLPNFPSVPLQSYTQGPVNSAVPWAGYTTTPALAPTTPPPTTTTQRIAATKDYKLTDGLSKPVGLSDFHEQDVEASDLQAGAEQDLLNQVYKKNLADFWTSYNEKEEKEEALSDEDLAYNRVARKISFSSSNSKNITGLIKKALSLVKKVEEIDKRKKSLESTISNSRPVQSAVPSARASEEEERARELKEEKRFNDLKTFIKDQTSISSLIKSETAEIRDLFNSRSRDLPDSSTSEKKSTREMIKALSKLNSISSLLLRDNESTKSRVRELPAEIRGIVQTEVDGLKDLLEDQNSAVAGALKSALRNEELRGGRDGAQSETDIIILKALSKLNRISGVLLKEQEKTERQTNSALKALPALASFIQAETSDIKDLLEEQTSNDSDKSELAELRKAVAQSLSNDKLITRAIIKLNDITQLLLRDVNFTTVAVTNKLPRALATLITSETSKIRKMIDVQNDAIVDILEESDNLARAERVIKEAQQIKASLAGGGDLPAGNNKQITESDRLLALLKPLLSKDSKFTESTTPEEERTLKLIEILEPILKKEIEDETEDLTESVDKQTSEPSPLLETQLAGQKSIVKALLKLTNITRTLLDDKQQEQEQGGTREEPRSSSQRKKEHNEYEEEYEEDEEYYDDVYESDLPQRKSKKGSLVERVAGTSAGSRALKGNQALFEEFVKLAIERQRWDQAQDVTRIIQDSLTTTRRPKKRRKEYEEYDEYEEEYDEFEYDEEKELREQPRSQRPRKKKPHRTRPVQEDDRENRRDNRKHLAKPIIEEQDDDDKLYDLVERPSRSKFRPASKATQRPRPKRPTRPSRRPKTTTEGPLEYEEYLDYEEYQLELEEEDLADELVDTLIEGLEEELAEEEDPVSQVKLFPARGSSLRQSNRNKLVSKPETRQLPAPPPRQSTRFSRPRPPSVIPPTQRLPPTAPSRADLRASVKAVETRRPSNEAQPTPHLAAVPAVPLRDEKKEEVASSNSKIKNLSGFADQNERSKELLNKLLHSISPETRDDNIATKDARITTKADKEPNEDERAVLPLSRTDSRRLFGGRRRKKKPFQRTSPRANTVSDNVSAVKEESKLRSQNVQTTESSVSFSVSRSKSVTESSLDKEKKKMLQSALNNLHRIAGQKAKEKALLTETLVKPEAPREQQLAVSEEVKDLRGAAASRPRFLNPTARGQQRNKPTSSRSQTSTFQPSKSQTQPSRPQPTDSRPQASSSRPQNPPSKPQGSPPTSSSPSRRPTSARTQKLQSHSVPRGQVPARPKSFSEVRDEDRGQSSTRPQTFRPKRPRPVFKSNRSTPSTSQKSQRLEIETTTTERPERAERPPRPLRPKPVFQRPVAVTPSAILPPIQLKPKDPAVRQQADVEANLPNVEPLSEEEKAKKTSERNQLLNLLSKNRKGGRPGGRSSRPAQPAPSPTQPFSEEIKLNQVSALENLFQIVTTSSSSSSSSSSSFPPSSGVRITSHGRKQAKRKKGQKRPSPTKDPELQSLSPQERLVKKVQETLVVQEGHSLRAQDRPRGVRKKVILRKEKDGSETPREGRRLGGGAKIKTRKIRVRRPEEEEPRFPIVY